MKFTGGDAYSAARSVMPGFNDPGIGAGAADVSEALRAAGIPGIRYLDQGSRGAGTGTKNSVVFDANTMNIIRRYGLAGLLGGGGSASSAAQPMSDTALHLHVHTGDRGPDTPPAVRDLTGSDPTAYPKDLDDLHAKLTKWFEESRDGAPWMRSKAQRRAIARLFTITTSGPRRSSKELKERTAQPADRNK